VVARLGGDEFAVLLPGVSAATAVAHARAVHDALCEPVPLLGVELTSSASIGVTEFFGTSHSSDEVLAQADVAMYAAKAGRTGVQAYRAEDGHSTARRLALAADLKAALRGDALDLFYQPQACARTGRVTGFEALLRWDHPQLGHVPPPEIIAVAHRTGLVRELTDSILGQALRARASWAAAGHDLDVSVNVTPADVADQGLVECVDAVLAATGTPPGALVLEITESDAMRDPERSLLVLGALQARGVRLSIDDFGTGHSSLAYLDRLPVHEVKIDQSFVFRLEKDPTDSTIVRATVTLAHDLGLRVVAEGVENDLARSLVTEMGCDLFQGFGLARPMPARELLTWLARHEALTLTGRPAVAAPRATVTALRTAPPV
jgi:predicted signal transduction protein with EAL and GGDEF domain